MSATMARQGGWVQLEQIDMRLVLNMAKMAKGGFSRPAIEETQYLLKNARTEVWEEKKWGVDFPRHKKVKAGIETHPAMLCQNHTNGCLPCPNGTAKNLQTRWRRKGTGAPPPDWHRQPTPDLTPCLPGMPHIPPGVKQGAECPKCNHLPPRYVYSHTPLPSAQFFNLDAYAKDSQPDTDYNPDMLTDDGTSTG